MESVAEALERLATLARGGAVTTLSTVFRDAGRELALVGGSVRDAFLGRPITDLDFATNATPDEIVDIVRGIASTTWDVGRDFGTIGALVHDERVEITTYRRDTYDRQTRKPLVAFGDSLEGDLARRDFTVNAMALALPAQTLVDPSNGFADLVAGVLRTPATPEESFGDDPLRMLRAARFAAQLGFTVTPEVRSAMSAGATSLEIVSAERIRDELVKLLAAEDPVPGIRLLVETGLADFCVPELPLLIREHDEHGRHKDVYEHSLMVLSNSIELEKQRNPGAPADVTGRLAALLHDIGKPQTREFDNNSKLVTFYGHDVVGARLVKKRLQALRFDNDTISHVSSLIRLHLRFFGYSEGGWTDSAVRRYVRDAGDDLERLHILVRSDVTTRNERKRRAMGLAYDEIEARIEEIREREEIDAIRPDLDGDDIMRILNLTPGPGVGAARAFLLELRLDEGPLGPEEAEQRLREWAQGQELS